MRLRKGIQANNSLKSGIFDNFSARHDTVFVGRVKDIILNNQYPNVEKYGGSSAIGGIFFEIQNHNAPGLTFAKPFYPQFSSYPLINELVLIQKLPGDNLNEGSSNEVFYYINMINLWNHPHHNAFPNAGQLNTSATGQQTNEQVSQGITRQKSSNPTGIDLNSENNPSQRTFVERDNIHPLLPFSGDIIHQGRWSNTIRLGSTNISEDGSLPPLNEWSSTGVTGDPITILRNGQPKNSSNQGWSHIIEDVNNDLSSIYLTSTQTIPLSPSSENYRSFPSPPESVQSFQNPQIILNSDRIILNAKTDSVLLSAQKSVNLSTNGSVNINTKNFLIDAGNIRLGSKDARESVIKGDTLYFQLDQMLKALLQMLAVLKTSTMAIDPTTVTADSQKNLVYDNVETTLELIQQNLESIKSKNVKTI
jgi:hypothetical protein